jgi:FkbM family methyltransferase
MTFISYAQNYEDVMLVRALRGIEHGFYIDVGAQDPVNDSVTKAFYEMGWRGINIEPVAHWFQQLVADRPHDINLQLAVSDSPGTLHLFEVVNSGLSTTDPDFAARHAKAGHQIQESDVECMTLDSICEAQRVTEVHFLKIDCEGGEAAALRGLPLDRVRPWIILVEATEPNSQKPAYAEWEPLLTGGGYHFVYEDGLNRFYVADERKDLDRFFSHPPNIFDGFVRVSEMAARRHLAVAQEEMSLLHDVQRVAQAESECELLRNSAEYLSSENERREAALVEYRRLLEEAAEREAQSVALVQGESEQWRINTEYLRSENERREAALVEYRHLIEEAVEREAQTVARAQAESEQWRINTEHLRSENDRREAALANYRRLLEEATEREAQSAALVQAESEWWRINAEHLRGENDRREAALADYRRLLEEATEREARAVARAQGESEHWRINAEYLRSENERREAALTEHRRLLEGAVEREARSVALVQAESEQWRNHAEFLRAEDARKEQLLAERKLANAALEEEVVSLSSELANYGRDVALLCVERGDRVAEISSLHHEIGRLHHEVAHRDREIVRLHELILTIGRSTSWRITYPLRLLKHGLRALARGTRRVLYHLLRWPARLVRPLLRQLAKLSWLRWLVKRVAGVDSRLTEHMRLFLFDGKQGEDEKVRAAPDVKQPDAPMTRQATRVLEEIRDAKRQQKRGDGPSQSREL